jgi:hypothetical protein
MILAGFQNERFRFQNERFRLSRFPGLTLVAPRGNAYDAVVSKCLW